MRKGLEEHFYLTVDIVRKIHAEAIKGFSGSDGLRDRALLESAVAAPQATMFGKLMFSDTVEIAAAYLFYLCRNHPFVDGNKRTALGACIVFLRLNGVETPADGPQWEAFTFDVAGSRINREETTTRLRQLLA